MWQYNKNILYTYATSASSLCYAFVDGLGWRRIKPGAPDGVTNLYNQMNAARANDRRVHLQIDANNQIIAAYLL